MKPYFVVGVSNWFSGLRKRLKRSRRYARFRDWLARVRRRYVTELASPYLRYLAGEFAPYVAAYGVVVGVPMHFLFGYGLSLPLVVSWGLVFYLVDEELVSWLNELKPYVRVKVDE